MGPGVTVGFSVAVRLRLNDWKSKQKWKQNIVSYKISNLVPLENSGVGRSKEGDLIDSLTQV